MPRIFGSQAITRYWALILCILSMCNSGLYIYTNGCKKQPKSTQSPLGSKNLARFNWLDVGGSITPFLVIHSFLSRTFNFNQLQFVQLIPQMYRLYPVVGHHHVSLCYKLLIFHRKTLPSSSSRKPQLRQFLWSSLPKFLVQACNSGI